MKPCAHSARRACRCRYCGLRKDERKPSKRRARHEAKKEIKNQKEEE
jgi:hypothetical protein